MSEQRIIEVKSSDGSRQVGEIRSVEVFGREVFVAVLKCPSETGALLLDAGFTLPDALDFVNKIEQERHG